MTARKLTALLTSIALMVGVAPSIFAQSSTAAIAGVILDPSGRPASGFKVVLRDTGSEKDFTSEPTDAQGNYTAKVPVGGRYKIQYVVADDGVTKLPVQELPPVSVLTAGTTRLNVRFMNPATPAGTTTAAATPEEKKKKDKGATPWYHKPGPIVGLVLGSLAVVAILASGGSSSNNNNASPSTPVD